MAEIPLFTPLTIRGVTLRNRVIVSPMCQYSSTDGFADDWHLVHLGSRAVGGAGLVFTEATAVSAEGRISHGCLGIWKEEHIPALKRITDFIHRMGATSGIQIAHAGRKASCLPPWQGGASLKSAAEGGWLVMGPSPIPFDSGDPIPQEMTLEQIARVKGEFVAAAKRAVSAGFQVIEIHSAHGYLLHQFLSPLSNLRKDKYGGSLENRMRFLLETTEAIRAVIPEQMPLFVRISATDWAEGGWDIDQSVILSGELKKRGVDLIDCSSGALVPHVRYPIAPGYQVPFAETIRKHTGIMTSAVGAITDPDQANEIITSGKADAVMLAREMLREPYWALKAQEHFHLPADWPLPYGFAVGKRH